MFINLKKLKYKIAFCKTEVVLMSIESKIVIKTLRKMI